MHIIELIIDGFKSYAHRTVLKGFDQNFTAITGLNGSGKSNIIDAISFVLGNKNYAQLRVDNAQNLIYKNGQAGVQKASVTVVFSNEDKSMSPPGYERWDQITVTRQVRLLNRIILDFFRIALPFSLFHVTIHSPPLVSCRLLTSHLSLPPNFN